MITKTQAQKIDSILNLLNKKSTEHINARLFPKTIKDELGIPSQEIIHLFHIMSYLHFESGEIITFYDGDVSKSIEANFNTKKFIAYGGCLQFYHDQMEIQRKNDELEQLEKQKLLNDIRSFKITKRQFYWTIGIAIFGSITSLLLLLNQIFNFF